MYLNLVPYAPNMLCFCLKILLLLVVPSKIHWKHSRVSLMDYVSILTTVPEQPQCFLYMLFKNTKQSVAFPTILALFLRQFKSIGSCFYGERESRRRIQPITTHVSLSQAGVFPTRSDSGRLTAQRSLHNRGLSPQGLWMDVSVHGTYDSEQRFTANFHI